MGFSLSELRRFSEPLKSRQAGVIAFVLLVVAVAYKVCTSEQPLLFAGANRNLDFPELGGARFPQYSAFTSSFVSSIWPLTILAIALALIAVRLGKAIARSHRPLQNRQPDPQSGTSAVELVLVLPPLTVLLVMILQIALIVQAKFVVNYAAFCAARSAIVIIPDAVSANGVNEGHNYLANPNRSEKLEIIHRAAALPLTAVSPMPSFSYPIITDPNSLGELFKLAPFDVGPRSMMAQVMLRAAYAYHPENTAVKVLTADGSESGAFREHDWVTVKVSYRYYLAVPFAKRLFGTTYSGHWWSGFFGAEYYYPIVEQYTLPVDGEPILPG